MSNKKMQQPINLPSEISAIFVQANKLTEQGRTMLQGYILGNADIDRSKNYQLTDDCTQLIPIEEKPQEDDNRE
jgi:hypothetical protein